MIEDFTLAKKQGRRNEEAKLKGQSGEVRVTGEKISFCNFFTYTCMGTEHD